MKCNNCKKKLLISPEYTYLLNGKLIVTCKNCNAEYEESEFTEREMQNIYYSDIKVKK